MNKEKMTVTGAFLNHKADVEDGNPDLANHFAVVSFVTGDRKIARMSMSIGEAAELCFTPSKAFLKDMRLAEDVTAFVKERETAKHKAEWLAAGQTYAAQKAVEYEATHNRAAPEEYIALWGREGFRYAGQPHMAAVLLKYRATAERRRAKLMAKHARWAFSMFQRTLANGEHTPAGMPSNIGGIVQLSGHELQQVFSRKGVPDGYGSLVYPPLRFPLWGEDRDVYKIVRETDTQPVQVAFLGMPYALTEERMFRKLKVDEDLRLQFARGEL